MTSLLTSFCSPFEISILTEISEPKFCAVKDNILIIAVKLERADVEIVITRTGTGISGTMSFTGADGTVMTETFEALDIMTADAPCYVFIGGEGAYIELLSVE